MKFVTSQQSFSFPVQLVFRHISGMSQRGANAFSSHLNILTQEGEKKKNLTATSVSVSALVLSFDTIYMFYMTSFFRQGVST